VKTFSIGYAGDYPSYRNEFEHARRIARLVGADHHERILEESDLLSFLPQMVHLQDEPIGDPVCVPVYYVSKLARDNAVIVCQVGEGADELFWGYPSWRTLLRLQRYDDLPVPLPAKRLLAGLIRAGGKADRREYEYLQRALSGLPVFWGGADVFSETQKRRVLSAALRSRIGGITSWDAIAPIRKRFEEKAWERSHLNWMSYVDLNLRLPELLLMRVDKMSMGVSLEGRVPFLDHRFVELAMSIPEEVKTRNDTLKHILKLAVRGLVPDEIIDRPKQGFGVPVHEWFLARLGGIARREIEEMSRRTDLFNRAEALRLIDERRGTEAWLLLNLALWWKHYIERVSVEDLAA